MQKETIQLILGMKVRLLRQEQELTLKQLSDKSGITLSFLHDIEKGKKYPSADKLLDLAKALGTTYDYLVSVHGSKKLQPVVELLESEFLRTYPLSLFGIEPAALVELLTKSPDKISAFVSTAVNLVRTHHVSRENLYIAALRSYQDLHNNHFPELEEKVREWRITLGLSSEPGSSNPARLEEVLNTHFGVRCDRTVLVKNTELRNIRSYYSEKNKLFYLNTGFSPAQENFLLYREIAYQALGLRPRAYETIIQKTENFEVLLNNFKASYFASAMLMNQAELKEDLQTLFAEVHWNPASWVRLLDRYDVTPEMFMQRLTNVLVSDFGLGNLFFIRINGNADLNDFEMTKELHLSGQQSPHANERKEHYCRRWISIGILRTLRTTLGSTNSVICDAQLSTYHDTDNTYLCVSMAKTRTDGNQAGVSVTLGLKVDNHLRRTVQWVGDPALKYKLVNTTCEQCSIADCGARAAAPTESDRLRKLKTVEEELGRL